MSVIACRVSCNIHKHVLSKLAGTAIAILSQCGPAATVSTTLISAIHMSKRNGVSFFARHLSPHQITDVDDLERS